MQFPPHCDIAPRAPFKPPMVTIASRLMRARIAAGYKTAKEFAEKNGIPQPTYALHESGKRGLSRPFSKDDPRPTIVVYAEKLGVRQAWLQFGEEPMRSGTNAQGANKPQGNSEKREIASQNDGSVTYVGELKLGPKDLPILGYVKAGAEGVFIHQGEIQGVTMRPDSLLGVIGAYAVRVHDVSMTPALQPGWLVHVDPNRPCKPGDYVVVQMQDGAAYVKILVRRTEKHVICRQLNPEGEVRYETSKWRATHRVVGAKFLEE